MNETAVLPRSETPDAVADLQRRRAEFVHDWLRNRFLPRLQACIALADAAASISEPMAERFRATVREWPERGLDAVRLADDYGEVMSPARVVDDLVPAISPSLAFYLRSTASELWQIRHGVSEVVDEIRAAYDSANRHYAAGALRALASDCERIACAFARLPGRVVL